MTPAFVVLLFVIIGADSHRDDAPLDSSEPGQVIARSCEIAERFIRDGLRPAQTVEIQSCEPVTQGMAEVMR